MSYEWTPKQGIRCIVYDARLVGTEGAPHWDRYSHRFPDDEPAGAEILRLVAALRVLVQGLFDSVTGTIEGPDIEDLLEQAGLIGWTTFDSTNPEHLTHDLAMTDIEDGDRIWWETDFARELLKHDNLQEGGEDVQENHR